MKKPTQAVVTNCRAPTLSPLLPQLPAWKAFLVQFSREAGSGSQGMSGRVEHLSSGRRSRFRTREELLDIFEAMLADLQARSEPGGV